MSYYPYWIWLAGASSVTFIAYGLDKAQSKADGRRVPEIVLHGLALIGGFPGGWAGRAVFHHKTRKTQFALVLFMGTVLHIGLVYWLLVK